MQIMYIDSLGNIYPVEISTSTPWKATVTFLNVPSNVLLHTMQCSSFKSDLCQSSVFYGQSMPPMSYDWHI